ncbi:MAG: pyruvate formate lyase family protein [Limisphaerales bacterium]
MNSTPPLLPGQTRREFLTETGAAIGALGLMCSLPPAARAKPFATSHADMAALREDIISAPVRIALHRAKAFTRVFQENEDKPWIVRKGMALREHLRTVPLYVRQHDRIAGSITELPGAMPVMAELGIAENNIYMSENPQRKGYLRDQVPADILDYWRDRNLWGRARASGKMKGNAGTGDPTEQISYKFIAHQGHLSPSYDELLKCGLDGLLKRVRERRTDKTDADQLAFLTAAEHSLLGVSEWAQRYADFLAAEAKACADSTRAADLREMSRIAAKVAHQPPATFREALQLVWFCHQTIHIEGHGYSCTPDHIDQRLQPFYAADKAAGRLDEDEALRLCENFVLKMHDNTFWGPEHHLTQGLCVSGSTPDGRDLTNGLSWHFITAATNLLLPEPLVWVRWHPNIDQKFFDYCLSRLAMGTCFPMLWSDAAIPDALMGLGVTREDAFRYVPVGCNELAVPGQFYFNPGANCDYLGSIESALTGGRGALHPLAPAAAELKTFDQFAKAVGVYMRRSIENTYHWEMAHLQTQMQWGQSPFTSCFFDGCIEKAQDLTRGTKYNILTCGGIAFANAVDSLAAIREVVYEKKSATLEEVAAACRANFKGHERLHAQLLAAPKHGNDDDRLDGIIRLVERLRDEPMREICRDPRDGSRFGNGHVVRSGAVTAGWRTPATPDGRLGGTPLASSVAASCGAELSGPTAVLNSVAKLNSKESWQCGYQVNLRFRRDMVAVKSNRDRVRAMLNTYFARGGQEMQINCIDTAMLRAAQKDPGQYRDLVVRIAGFSAFFVQLHPAIQEDVIARMQHA